MKNTGSTYNTPLGSFSAAKGELRLLNVTAGFGGRSYLAYTKVPQALHDFCLWLNHTKATIPQDDILAWYRFSFEAHYRLVTIHPWADGNGRMSRLVMNMLQSEQNLIPVKVLKEQKSAYIEALYKTRDQENIQNFFDTMLQLHTHNLQADCANGASRQCYLCRYYGAPLWHHRPHRPLRHRSTASPLFSPLDRLLQTRSLADSSAYRPLVNCNSTVLASLVVCQQLTV